MKKNKPDFILKKFIHPLPLKKLKPKNFLDFNF